MRLSVFSRMCGLVTATAVIVLLASGLCFAVSFTADSVTKFGPNQATSKLYVSSSNWRQDMTGQGRSQTVIGRGDKNVTYFINPVAREYMERKGAIRPWSASMTAKLYSSKMTRKVMGQKTVNGIACERVVYSAKGQPGSITQYVAKDLDLPVLTEIKAPHGVMTVEFKNIKRITPPASLFQLPKGYKKVTPKMPAQAAPPSKRK